MTTLTKICLTISATGFVAGGIIDFGNFSLNPIALIVLPLGAVFFGASLISFMLENEMAKFDADEAHKLESAKRDQSGGTKCNACGTCRCQPSPKLLPATAG